MNFLDTIKSDMYDAMKSGDKDKAGTLRTLLAKLKDRQINNRKDLTEKDCISVIKTLVKQREEAADMYEKAGREGLAQKEKYEFDVLNSYLPETMSEAETRNLVESVISETNANGLMDMGKVMPLVMQKGGDAIDGKMANQILRELLE
ncbi:MAG: GatB/YqeY domain-containing protein [Candidatus Neomarinimicrobiota bacterium]|nr:glutamyl-tRNA amidotransferase [Candidatus Neomarinimicrobiota bacterium]|tara:strand:+ start:436 stop:879 length:444 start_codon:yes stop_codon:yes gene_type:complete